MAEGVEVAERVVLGLEGEVGPVDDLAGDGESLDRRHSRVDERHSDTRPGHSLAPERGSLGDLVGHVVHRPGMVGGLDVLEEGGVFPTRPVVGVSRRRRLGNRAGDERHDDQRPGHGNGEREVGPARRRGHSCSPVHHELVSTGSEKTRERLSRHAE